MSPSPSLPSEYRLKWKKRMKESSQKTAVKKQKSYQEEEEDGEEEEEEVAGEYDETNDEQDHNDCRSPVAELNCRQMEVLSGTAIQLCTFPSAVKHGVSRAHATVLALVAAEHNERLRPQSSILLENISHGQLQALSAIPADSPCLLYADQDKEGSFSSVCIPSAILPGSGVLKKSDNFLVHVVPMHADWFSPNTVHRLERQAVPHFFSGKSSEHTPEGYMEIRNKIIAKYLENPVSRLAPSDCHGLAVASDTQDLTRIARFLDRWGIINYMASSVEHQSTSDVSLQENSNGDLQVPSGMLRTIDSLISFDKPTCKFRIEDVYSPILINAALGASDLDYRLREKLSENSCHHCSTALPHLYYQSQKEVDIVLCMDCFHDGKFVAGHTSMDFVRVDPTQNFSDLDGDNWSDQETLLLLEAVAIYNDNWNEIAEHVSTKTKAQCLLHFIRLPTQNDLLENIEFSISNDNMEGAAHQTSYSQATVASEGSCLQLPDCKNKIPFANSENPVMSLVAFLTSALGPRVAATCAHASLASLEEPLHGERFNSQGMNSDDRCNGRFASTNQQKEDAASAPLSPEKVRAAAEFGLSAAAMKAKLFSEHEEREIQRLAATIVNHKLKRLEIKLKQFAELETLLIKESEQMESTRQKMASERARLMSVRLAHRSRTSHTAKVSSHSGNSNWQPVVASSSCPPLISAFSSNQAARPHMSFMPHQLSFNPCLPLSMTNVTVSPGTLPTSSVTVTSHAMLRPITGSNTNPST